MAGQEIPNEASLQRTLVTHELKTRFRAVDHANENFALLRLGDALVAEPDIVLQQLSETILDTCRAQSAGLSILERADGQELFRWTAVVGAFAQNSGGTMPRNESPCSIVIDTEEVQLFRRPELSFAPLKLIEPPIQEALLAPFYADGRPAGTIWAITHDMRHQFDSEDARLLGNLTRFASAYFRLVAAREVQKSARRDAEERLSEVEALRKRQQVLLRELNHRVGNLLTVVSSIANKTVGRGRPVADFQQRITALSRAQNLITKPEARASLAEVVDAELNPYMGTHSAQVKIEGPHAVVDEAHVQALSLAVHELATNAIKYGALKASTGRLEIKWELRREGAATKAVLEWCESGVDVSQDAMDRQGFGRELIERSLGRALDADVNYQLHRNGVVCTIVLPVEVDQ
ncbi:sensor histidine kinase [Chelativorans salis]|uniref:histidine kinase n=1 Tax=Chelativorans salis TaxID=2978478 RepID=A0ABT2LVY5_9HYPH|nr:HWE histidine kinase domain-containing protein [Chelativorans sp. EGI FJ00035]MCT7378675.1 GAF domain-containing protein [Chelativorans sp. EGI FJ00035]